MRDASLDGYAEDGEIESMADVARLVNVHAMTESLARRQRSTIVPIHAVAVLLREVAVRVAKVPGLVLPAPSDITATLTKANYVWTSNTRDARMQ